jgi:hypothetical protein
MTGNAASTVSFPDLIRTRQPAHRKFDFAILGQRQLSTLVS